MPAHYDEPSELRAPSGAAGLAGSHTDVPCLEVDNRPPGWTVNETSSEARTGSAEQPLCGSVQWWLPVAEWSRPPCRRQTPHGDRPLGSPGRRARGAECRRAPGAERTEVSLIDPLGGGGIGALGGFGPFKEVTGDRRGAPMRPDMAEVLVERPRLPSPVTRGRDRRRFRDMSEVAFLPMKAGYRLQSRPVTRATPNRSIPLPPLSRLAPKPHHGWPGR